MRTKPRTMNTQTVHLNMTPQGADSIAHVLMTSLHEVSMLDRERDDTVEAVNLLFDQLGYGYHTDEHGRRTEDKRFA
jgi:hypothetical protein